MEGTPRQETAPKQSPYLETGNQFRNQLRLFESHAEVRFETPAEAIFGFAEFIRSESMKVLEHVRTHEEGQGEREHYRLEQSAAKLHEFNLANAAVLHRFAELVGDHPESIGPLVDTFPWLREVARWADDYMERTH